MVPNLAHDQFQADILFFVQFFNSYSIIFHMRVFGHLAIISIM